MRADVADTGFSDTGTFFLGASPHIVIEGGKASNLFSSAPGRTVGYSMFLRVLHAITPHLILVTIVQHVLGLGAALLFFLAVRR